MRPHSCNKRVRAIPMQRLCKHAKIPEPSISNVRTQEWRSCRKRCFLCGPYRRHIRGPGNDSGAIRELTAEVGGWQLKVSPAQSYQLKPAVIVLDWRPIVDSLRGREPGSRERSTLKAAAKQRDWEHSVSQRFVKCSY
jgi:hypothetical protein